MRGDAAEAAAAEAPAPADAAEAASPAVALAGEDVTAEGVAASVATTLLPGAGNLTHEEESVTLD
jgi:hypothetical protein